MKPFPSLLVLLCASLCLFSCKKFNETSLESEQRAQQFNSFVNNKKFRVTAFYASEPIDYIEDDAEVREETDLFRYVSPWLLDDGNLFDVAITRVTIEQNENKISNISDDIILRNCHIGYDDAGVYFDFLNYRYEPLRYRLVEFNDNYFIVSVEWKNGIRLYTKFTQLKI